MVFNALVTNLDDHPRNHAVIGTATGGWRLSPAFDLVASNAASTDNRELAMTCGALPGRERWASRDCVLARRGAGPGRDEPGLHERRLRHRLRGLRARAVIG
jgi:serine/threonine-protein kinase HipA